MVSDLFSTTSVLFWLCIGCVFIIKGVQLRVEFSGELESQRAHVEKLSMCCKISTMDSECSLSNHKPKDLLVTEDSLRIASSDHRGFSASVINTGFMSSASSSHVKCNIISQIFTSPISSIK